MKALERALERSRTSFPNLRKFARTLQIEWEGPDPVVTKIYRRTIRYFFHPVSVIAMLAITLGGVVAFLAVEHSVGSISTPRLPRPSRRS